VDRYFYGFWAVPFLGSFHFNVLLGNGALYGTHPWYWYIIAGLPAISGITLPFFLLETATLSLSIFRLQQSIAANDSTRKPNRRMAHLMSQALRQHPATIVVIIILCYVALHSASGHKEFRFLLPILPLICVLAGHGFHRFITAIFSSTAFRGTKEEEDGAMDDHLDGSNDLSERIPVLDNGHTKSPRSKHKRTAALSILFTITCLLNYPHLLFLCTIHQRAPIDINRSIVNLITSNAFTNTTNTTEPTVLRYTVHYLMGCHSTPVHSHLHIPPLPPHGDRGGEDAVVSIEPWTLDCSPECRADPSRRCEDEDYRLDPRRFLERVYKGENTAASAVDTTPTSLCAVEETEGGDAERRVEVDACSMERRLDSDRAIHAGKPVPDFLAVYEEDVASSSGAVEDMVRDGMGMVEVERLRHSIRKVSFVRGEEDDGTGETDDGLVYRNRLMGMGVKITFEHMILFAKKEFI